MEIDKEIQRVIDSANSLKNLHMEFKKHKESDVLALAMMQDNIDSIRMNVQYIEMACKDYFES